MNNSDIDYQNYDRAFKDAFTTFQEKVPPFIDLDLPEIDRFLETEFVEIETKENKMDMNFILKDGSILHLEEEIHLSVDDVIRFAQYDLKLYRRYKTKINTVVFCVNRASEGSNGINAGSFNYKLHIVDFSAKDADLKLKEVRNRVKSGMKINELELVFFATDEKQFRKSKLS